MTVREIQSHDERVEAPTWKGRTSPFGTWREMPVYIEESILGLPRILINGGR